jgi:hypothetical protein
LSWALSSLSGLVLFPLPFKRICGGNISAVPDVNDAGKFEFGISNPAIESSRATRPARREIFDRDASAGWQPFNVRDFFGVHR